MSFMLGLLVANDQLIREWLEEEKQYAYRLVDIGKLRTLQFD